jgi:hypothetical protein
LEGEGTLANPDTPGGRHDREAERAIVAALADRHPKDEVVRTLMRLAVTSRLAEAGGKYTLAGTGEAGQE